MSEEIKTLSKEELFILDLKCSTEPTLTEKGKDLLLNYIEDLQQKVEQLEKELKEKEEIINKFIADENGGVSYKLQNENERLQQKVEQLENILNKGSEFNE